jgi:hypothetical protein
MALRIFKTSTTTNGQSSLIKHQEPAYNNDLLRPKHIPDCGEAAG